VQGRIVEERVDGCNQRFPARQLLQILALEGQQIMPSSHWAGNALWIKNRVRWKVYRLYLKGVPLFNISQLFEGNVSLEDVDGIIDYMNEIYF
jgi:hypothetical protein